MTEDTLSESAAKFIPTVSLTARSSAVAEITKFVRWFGPERLPRQLSAHDVELYAEVLGPSAPQTSRKADHIRAFLTFLKKEGIVASSLAPSLRLRKSGRGSSASSSREQEPIELTQEGIDALKAELESLIAQRPAIRDAIRHAMLDKDFRENSPLDAAKDKQGHVEARIRDIEAMLKRAVVVDGTAGAGKVRVGLTVSVTNLAKGTSSSYSIVGPTEANAANGKISSVSPVGKALLDRRIGEEVEVAVPAGTMRLRIDQITV